MKIRTKYRLHHYAEARGAHRSARGMEAQHAQALRENEAFSRGKLIFVMPRLPIE